ncbi:hypothetical protein ATDW_34030 (plasmid) [Asticcacaulis sp. DW145]|jgi:hypothetical protein|uniref:Uncharacterized protein n=1 Tax=Asticcacaulis currens TaxID=2984210 RepID=A0ABT5IE51_9CAUL|nr:hypothetical protein [Asticcacaulis currens]MDC7694472.1 hypothetical protein [Asticcacaulis currens]BEV12907.1 hypothetical protein ATDW_34030 [Asticcacaulis sp. DW145]
MVFEMSGTQKDVRSLANLGETASTSRVLNLGYVYRAHGELPEYTAKPFFANRQMNRALILKHTLRANEQDLFTKPRRTTTKIILPFDPDDLKLGGQSVLVGQVGYDNFLRNIYNTKTIAALPDVEVLRALDELPSLDPFLVREHLGRRGYRPASCYLHITQADIARMIGFANGEIESLVREAFGSAMQQATLKLAGKILANELDNELDPLRMTLRLSSAEFSDGIFSWRGFLYFKWRYTELQGELNKVLNGLATYQPMLTRDKAVLEFLADIRPRLAKRISLAIVSVGRTLAVYDQAYLALTKGHDPGPFRRFLLEGPSLFFELGEHIGILSHISSFWNYRMSRVNRMQRMSAEEYSELLMDYSDSLSALYLEDESTAQSW